MHRRRTFFWALVLTGTALPALAQSTRDEWLALRTPKQARHHRNPTLATRPNAFTITTIRFFSDSSGNLVGVGEARNDTSFDLSYSRLNFRFLDAGGKELGREWTYLLGGVNAQLVITNAYETLLVPGATGFFKIWTTIPASSMASYTTETAGESLPYAKPRASLGAMDARPETWAPLVYFSSPYSPNRLAGQRFSTTVFNDDPLSPNCPCAHPHVFTSSVQVSIAAYLDGILTDVQSATAVGPRRTAQCTEPQATGMTLHQTSAITIDFSRPVDSIRLYSVEWDENAQPVGASPSELSFDESGGKGSFTVNQWCGETAVASAPWIRVTQADSPGRIAISAERNAGTTPRIGSVSLAGSGLTMFVSQTAVCPAFSPQTVFLGGAQVSNAPVAEFRSSCLLFEQLTSSASWLRALVDRDDKLRVSADPNFTGAIRTAVVTLAKQSITIHQNPASRTVDLNSDGKLDLLWHHRREGAVAVWWMNGVEMRGGTVLAPRVWWDADWAAGTAADLNRDGFSDVVWYNTTDPQVYYSLSSETRVLWTNHVNSMPDSVQWKLRSSEDFNADGDPDLVWQQEATGELQVWLMRSASPLPPPYGTPPHASAVVSLGPGRVTDLNWKIVGSADFNRDGWPDVVWQHQTDGRIAVWNMHGTAFIESAPLGLGRVADFEWKIRAVGDINGDHMPDLIWQHRVDGRVAVWLMNGTTMMSAVVIAQLTDTNWEIVGPR